MAVHIGKKIREEVDRQGMRITVFAKKINRSRNVVYDIFERGSVDTDLLHKIGKVLNTDFFSMYSAQKEYAHEGVKTFYAKEPDLTYSKSEETSKLQQQNQQLRNEIAYLKKIILLLEEKGKKKDSPKKNKRQK